MTSRYSLHLLLAALLVLPRPVAPATITVDGQTDDATPGICDLVEAIENANMDDQMNPDCAAGSGADEIVLTVDVTLVESENDDPLDGRGTPRIIDGSIVTIEGNGFTIARSDTATDQFRLFEIAPGGDLTLNHTTVTGGLVSNPGMEADARGGGIVNLGTLTLNHTTVSGNTAAGIAPGLSAYGGGIYNAGTATLIDSAVANNTASVTNQPGAGLHLAKGGGISNCNQFCPIAPPLTLVNTTVSGNTASVLAPSASSISAYGGGLYAPYGVLTITNSTFSGNEAYSSGSGANSYGGAISSADADLTLVHATLANNTVTAFGGYEGGAAVDYFGFFGGTVELTGSVLGYSTGGPNCVGITPGMDGGGNLADDASCGSIPATLSGLDPTLADNGGPTQTHALIKGSTAIDNAGDCSPVTRDQRGALRPVGECDSGSFELVDCIAPDGSDFTVPDQMLFDELEVVTCDSITVADTDVLGPDGHLILRTAGIVIVLDGFSVDATGRLTVENDGSITMPETD